MTVLLMLLLFSICLTIDYTRKARRVALKGTMYTTPGYEFLGALAQDGGEQVKNFLGEGI